jgi:hypothetical protein
VYACDICGSGGGNTQLGILPNYQRHFVGLRYRHSTFTSMHNGDIKTAASDVFQTTELFARYVPHQKIQLFAALPYGFTQRTESKQTQTVQAVGDVSLLATVIILNNSDSAAHQWKHALQVGGGVKLPTGDYQIVQNRQTLSMGLQPGSGSTDVLANLLYTVRYRKLGLNIDASYRYNTTNPDEYLQGNRFGCATRLFYWKIIKKCTLLPHLGASIETAEVDKTRGFTVHDTGGELLLANAGIDVFYKKIAFGIQVQNPILQHLNNGATTTNMRLSAQVLYLF